jgi:hypothetical protein
MERYMNTKNVETVLNDVAECDGEYSLGFRRYIYLPDIVRLNMQKAHFLLNGGVSAMEAIKAFLAGMSQDEYKLWLTAQDSGI